MAGAPLSLRERIMEAVSGVRDPGSGASGDRAAVLRQLAESLLADVKEAPPTRDTALTLLAADSLITLACEAAAESAPERLGDIR